MNELFTVFDWVEWTDVDKLQAQKHGWDIFDVNGALEIQALEGSDMSDIQAAKKVAEGADFGGALERKALLVLAKHIVTRQLVDVCDGLATDIDMLSSCGEDYKGWQCRVASMETLYRCAHALDGGLSKEQSEAKVSLMDALEKATESGLFDSLDTPEDVINNFCDAMSKEFDGDQQR